jgi:uncharacterized protein (UPF0332 family)
MTDQNRRMNLLQELARATEAFRAAEALLGLNLYADSVSRAYYAAFHVVRALLLSRGVEPKTHAGAIHLLNQEFIRPGLLPSSVNRSIAGLQRSREFADYDAATVFSAEDAQSELDSARAFEARERRGHPRSETEGVGPARRAGSSPGGDSH